MRLGFAWFYLASGRYATYQIRTHDSVSGLIADAPVEFHGVDVGRVARVELIDPESVSVLLHIRKDAPVTTATVATITSRGLASKGFTGYVYVSLEDDGTDARPVADSPANPYRQIRTAPSRSVSMDTAVSQVNENVQYITRLLQTSLDAKTIDLPGIEADIGKAHHIQSQHDQRHEHDRHEPMQRDGHGAIPLWEALSSAWLSRLFGYGTKHGLRSRFGH